MAAPAEILDPPRLVEGIAAHLAQVLDGTLPPPVAILDATPAPGTRIGRLVVLAFRTTPARRTILAVRFTDDAIYELAYDGQSFVGVYAVTQSTVNARSDGFAFTLWRAGGWPAAPTVIALPAG